MGDNEQGSEIQALGSQEAPPVVLSKTDDTEINIGALNTASSKCSAESARIWEILDYMRSTFDSDAMLDDLPISEACQRPRLESLESSSAKHLWTFSSRDKP